MDRQTTVRDEPRIVRPTAGDAPVAARRRTLGVCAHCRKAVDITDDYVRLYRRAWHLDCALIAEGRSSRSFD